MQIPRESEPSPAGKALMGQTERDGDNHHPRGVQQYRIQASAGFRTTVG